MVVVHNLPTQPTPFVGRVAELEAIARLLVTPDCRLLTLVGPGGMGKTRLALALAETLLTTGAAAAFPNGIYFVPLQPLTSPDFMLSALAEGVGYQFYAGDEPQHQLIDFLSSRTVLLILDNFEHLLEGVDLVSDLLAGAPNLKILATSREILNLQEEWLYQVRGMTIPHTVVERGFERYEAVQLFMQSARRIRADFSLAAEKENILRICQLVEGMPLALEMTAAWLKRLPCQEIALEVQRGLDVLTLPTRNFEVRHASMRLVLDHSWTQLGQNDQVAFRKLAVFRGGFRRDAAEQIMNVTLDRLSALVDKSLLSVDDSGRYTLHELVRQYALEQLERSAETEATQDAHSFYYLEFVADREADIKGRRQLSALAEIEAEFDNVRAAWEWALKRQQSTIIERTANTLAHLCDMASMHFQGEQLLHQATEIFTPASNDVLWARITLTLIWLTYVGSGEYRPTQAQLDQCGLIAEREGVLDLLASHRHAQALFYDFLPGSFEGALKNYRESLSLYRRLNDPFNVAGSLVWLGHCFMLNAEFPSAIENLEQAVAIELEIGHRFGVVWPLTHLAHALFLSKRFADAEQRISEAQALAQEVGNRKASAWIASERGEMATWSGDFGLAASWLETALDSMMDVSYFDTQIMIRRQQGLVAFLSEDDESGRGFFREYRSLAQKRGFAFVVHNHIGLGVEAYGLGDLERFTQYVHLRFGSWISTGDAGLILRWLPLAALLLGHEGEKEQAVELLGLAFEHPSSITGWMEQWALLTRFRTVLETELGSGRFQAAWKRGAARNLNTTIKLLVRRWNLSSPTVQRLPDPLTERELEVLRLVANGLSNRQIAHQLVIALGTVKRYVSDVYSKLDVSSRVQAVSRARDLNLL